MRFTKWAIRAVDAAVAFRRLAAMGLPVLLFSATAAAGQDLVPGAFSPAPTGFNLLLFSASFSTGGLSFDPTLPIEDANAKLGAVLVGYGRTFGLAGRFASVVVAVPYVNGHVEGLVLGQPQNRSLSGTSDPIVRLAVNMFGAPAMAPQQFAGRRFPTIAGFSVTVSGPWGQYDSRRYLNLGRHRWTVRPEGGVARTRGAWTFEGNLSASFFSDNDDYVNGVTQSQAPIWAVQGHLTYTIRRGLWVAADANYWRGGRLTTNGVAMGSELDNSRAGVTVALPVGTRQVRVAYSAGARTSLGGDFHSVGVSYTHAWK